ncbi:Xaa-Pro aminopeptidase [Thalassotalea profundi]|uniref:Xaa-Pro aminopeptidase n=1 Tax=Thalassotalea profundi TaxID=2036687 RepID=A0ABQ3IMF5_9GAMM|nr:Xaa-Pro aminopeptidase [Thalassotalea profundi]GHE85860.1 Xaa-Pro aminopeptidase [Thalassotalea profundi]
MINCALPNSEFVTRRQQFIDQMADNSIAVFFAGKEVTRSNDTEYLFCQDKNFLYLTGFNEPEAILIMVKSGDGQSFLFCREKDPFQEVWHGKRVGAEKAQSHYAFDQAFNLADFKEKFTELLGNKEQLWFCHGIDKANEQQLMSCLAKVKGQSRQGITAPNIIFDCQEVVNEMRLIKSAAEIAIMKQANVISGGAHQRAMEKCRPELYEFQIEAELLHEFARHGARHAAYNSIVAGGDNANILHYTENDQPLVDGELLLIDAGGELHGYAADITRTFPINGIFTEPQKQLYQLVLSAQDKAIAAIKPGVTLGELNDIACEVLTQGLLALGILIGDYQQLLNDKACKKYFIHGLGHWLGLDVHDVGDYQMKNKRQSRPFQSGMVLTIEPGLYIPADAIDVEEKWRGIGIRIEDNILVTDLGHENLTVNAPKSIKEIESIMAAQK